MERIIVKIIDLEHKINQDIDTLVDLKKDIMALIKTVKKTKIAFLTYTYGVNSESSRTKEELNSISIYKIVC